MGAKTVLLYVLMFLASFAVSYAVAALIRPGPGAKFENQTVYDGELGGLISIGSILPAIIVTVIISIILMTSFLSIFGLPVDLIGPIAAFYRLLDMALPPSMWKAT